MESTKSQTPSGSSTPNPNSRFTSQNATAEDLLKSQTVGLVHLSDFRKRRAEVLEQKERERQDRSLGVSGTPAGSGASTPKDPLSNNAPVKKKRKKAPKAKLSFALDEEEEEQDPSTSATATPQPETPENGEANISTLASDKEIAGSKRRLGPNSTISTAPRTMTKSALMREAQTRDHLRKEFLAMQEAVKATDIIIPFVFYDGTSTPGGSCRVKKGDHVWFFLDKARKLGAELGMGGDRSRRDWARVGVDDLMLVRGEIIIPHHYEFYYFIINKTIGYNGRMFNYSSEPTSASPALGDGLDTTSYDPLARSDKKDRKTTIKNSDLEGFNDDPTLTKVVDRRWYERFKHIYPASVWKEFDPEKDYTNDIRTDSKGNAFFFS